MANIVVIMPLSPELRHYAKLEGLDRDHFTTEIGRFRKDTHKEKAHKRKEKLVEGIFTTSEKAVQGFFGGLTAIRTLSPKAVELFPWEEWYMDTYGDPDNEKDRTKSKTWRELKDEGVDAKHMYVVYLQDKYVVPQKTIHDLAEQATTAENQKSWLDFNTEIQEILGDWVDRTYPAAIATGAAKGLLSVVPQEPDSALWLLSGGGVASAFYVKESARREDLGNNLGRMAGEFSSLLHVHYRTHERALAHFTDIPYNDIDQVSERIFTGSRLAIESTTVAMEAKAIAAGVTTAQTLHALGADNPSSFFTSLLIPAAAAGYIYHKIRKEKSGPEAVAEYVREQTALLDEGKAVKRELASQRGGSLSLDLYRDTRLGEKRKNLVAFAQEKNVKALEPLELAPWVMAISASFADGAIDSNPVVGSLIAGGIIASALRPYSGEFTRQRMAEVRRSEIVHLNTLINAIDSAPHHIPSDSERTEAWGANEVTERDIALEEMNGHPLIISNLDTGLGAIRTVNVDEPIQLEPGISFVVGPSSTGKSELLRMITLEQGDIRRLVLTRGIDLRQIKPAIRSDIITLVEAIPPNAETRLAQQLAPFIKDPDDNLFKRTIEVVTGLSEDTVAINDAQRHLNQEALRRLQFRYGKEIVKNIARRLFENNGHREGLIDWWMSNPHVEKNHSIGSVAKAILNETTVSSISTLFPYINNAEIAADYLWRKPGPTKGTSAGEGIRWEIFKAMLKERAILLLDEPTGNNLDLDSHYIDFSSFSAVAKATDEYMKRFPNSVVLVATNDDRLEEYFVRLEINRGHRVTDKRIEPTGSKQDLVWKAKKIR